MLVSGVPIGFDHAFAIVLGVFFPLRASTFGYRRLRRASEEAVPRVRLGLYRQAIALQWTLAAVLLALWASQGRAWSALGLVPRATPAPLIVAAALGVLVLVVLVQRRRALASAAALAGIRKRMWSLERMLPHTRHELRWFLLLSATAGVCEELLYRGFLIWYLGHWLGPYAGGLAAAIVFGAGHSYQGGRGMLTTALVGVVLGAVYLATGSIYSCMLIHALTDMHSGHLAHAALTAERESPAVETVQLGAS